MHLHAPWLNKHTYKFFVPTNHKEKFWKQPKDEPRSVSDGRILTAKSNAIVKTKKSTIPQQNVTCIWDPNFAFNNSKLMKWWCTTNVCLSAVFGAGIPRRPETSSVWVGRFVVVGCVVSGLQCHRFHIAQERKARQWRWWWWWDERRGERRDTDLSDRVEMRNRCQVCLALWNQFHLRHDENIFSHGSGFGCW